MRTRSLILAFLLLAISVFGQTPVVGGNSGGSSSQLHSITIVIDGGGSVISTGDIKFYPPVAFACTIKTFDITADQSGSITVDIWKAAGAIPTSSNKISSTNPVALSTQQLLLGSSASHGNWTTAVSSGDVFGANVSSATSVTRVVIQIWCN